MKDRIKEFKRIPANEILPNPKNWREHPSEQVKAFSSLLDEVGFADVVIVRETEAGYELIDGHMRVGLLQGHDIPAVVLDVTEEEASLLLSTLDPIGTMAKENKDKLAKLKLEMEDSLYERMKHIPSVSRTNVPDKRQPVKRNPLICPECGHEYGT